MPARAIDAPKELADPVKGVIGELVGIGLTLEKYEQTKQLKQLKLLTQLQMRQSLKRRLGTGYRGRKLEQR